MVPLLLQVYPPVSSCPCDLQSCEGEAEGDILVEAGTHCSRAACHPSEAAPRSLHPHLQWQEGESVGQPDITYGKSVWSRGYESVDSLQVNHCSTAGEPLRYCEQQEGGWGLGARQPDCILSISLSSECIGHSESVEQWK